MAQAQGTWGLVCQGGGGKGAWEAGFIYAAAQSGIEFSTCIGTSVGGLNCGVYLQCLADGRLDRLRELWLNVGAWDILGFPRPTSLGRFGLSNILKLERLIQGNVRPGDIEMLCTQRNKSLYLVATHPEKFLEWNMRLFRFLPPGRAAGQDSFGSLHAGLLASAAYPLVYPYVQQDTLLLIDGGLVDNNPLPHAVNTGCDRILVLTPERFGALKKSEWWRRWIPGHFMRSQTMRRVLKAQAYLADLTARNINALAPTPVPAVYFAMPSRPLSSWTFRFSRKTSAASFALGQKDGEAFLRQLASGQTLGIRLDTMTIPEPKRGLYELSIGRKLSITTI